MALEDQREFIVEYIKSHSDTLSHNKDIFDMYEGDVLKFIDRELKATLSGESYALAKHRMAPINIAKRIIDKLSKIYAKSPVRIVVDGNDTDKELLSYYEEEMQIDQRMGVTNELFNLHKNVSIEPFLSKDGKPRVRGIPADRSIWASIDRIDPLNGTHYMKNIGPVETNDGDTKGVDVWFVWTNEEFLAIQADGKVRRDVMLNRENLEGVNPISEIPAIYVNRSFHSIVPPIDTDFPKMVTLIPILLSDLNFAVMMQAFSIIYGIDVDEKNLKMSPNAFWSFKSLPGTNTKPEINMIKPQIDIEPVMNFIGGQLKLWLNSKAIKPGSVGTADPEQSASGISKIIDEMDTFEDRMQQVQFFKKAEEDMWNLITKKLHPFWRRNRMIDTNLDFSANAKIKVEFPEQLPAINRKELLEELILEHEKGYTTWDRVVKKLNPGLTDDDLILLEKDVIEERGGEEEEEVIEDDQQPPPQDEQQVEGGDLNAGEVAAGND